jgi:hypothetical protein
MPRAPRVLAPRWFLALAGTLALVGCGRRATKADCEIIIDRMVVVKLKSRNITDPASIEKMQGDLRKDADTNLQGCVGRRITDSAMACIQRADTEDAIIKCLR